MGPWDSTLAKERKEKGHIKSPKFYGIRDLSVITMNAHSLNPRITIP